MNSQFKEGASDVNIDWRTPIICKMLEHYQNTTVIKTLFLFIHEIYIRDTSPNTKSVLSEYKRTVGRFI